MSKQFFYRLSLAILFSSAAIADEVNIVSDRWYPYNGIPDSNQPGYVIEIAQYSLAKAGHTVKYEVESWADSLNLVRQGKKDCVIGAYKSEAPDFVFPEQHMGTVQLVFIKRKDFDWQYDGVESLKKVRLGAKPNYNYSGDIGNYIDTPNNPQVFLTSGKYALEYNLTSLVNENLDVVMEAKSVLLASIKKHGWIDETEFAGTTGKIYKIHFACSPKNKNSKEYTRLFSEGLKELRDSGQLHYILNKYGLTDWIYEDAEES